MLFGCRIFVVMTLSVHDGLLDVAWFCVCNLGGSLAEEMNVSFVVVVGASALRDRRVCALTLNVIGFLFLRQCFILIPSSTEISISGMSRQLPNSD